PPYPRHPRQRLPASGCPPRHVLLPRGSRGAAWTCRSGWGTVESRGFSGATASEQPVLECWGGTHHNAKEARMKELRATVSDEDFAELEHLAQVLGIPLEELLLRSVAAYLTQVKAERADEPIGFGMWADRPEMQDAAKWVADLRERAWRR